MQQLFVKLFEPKPNGPETAWMLANLLQVKISRSTLKREIEEHPDYPSLLSISDVLNNYGVDNLTARFDLSKFMDIPTPFITQLKGDRSTIDLFTVVKQINSNSIRLFDPEKSQWITLTTADFLKKSSGIVLLAEAGDKPGEKNYEKKIRAERIATYTRYFTAFSIPALVLFSSAMAFIRHGTTTLLPFLFTLLTLAGSAVCALLLWYEVDQYNPVLQQICSLGRKVNCKAVLQSKASKIGGISWSAIGFSYFMGMLLLLLFSDITSPLALSTLSWLNAIALPYVIFSVYYQWRVAKQWCVLCLCVQALLTLQLVTALVGGWHSPSPFRAIADALQSTVPIAFAIPILVCIILQPPLQEAQRSNNYYTELQKLKHNRLVFEALLKKEKELTTRPDGLGIVLGNPDASYKLIKVCNPYCGPCANAHKPMEKLLENNPDLQIQIIFTATNTEGDYKTAPVKHLLAIAENQTETILRQALDDWYLPNERDYETFATKYPMNGKLKQQSRKIAAMSEWCNEVKIAFTPTFFVSVPSGDGITRYYQLPQIYRVTDLKYFFSV